jgi:hypothetical protein
MRPTILETLMQIITILTSISDNLGSVGCEDDVDVVLGLQGVSFGQL